MRRSQGRHFTDKELLTIKRLLAETDLTAKDIALRMSCAKSSILTINQRFGIRDYGGRRSEWVCCAEDSAA
jgi:hypothetical protein